MRLKFFGYKLETLRFFAFVLVSFAGTMYKHSVRLNAAALFKFYKKMNFSHSKVSNLL